MIALDGLVIETLIQENVLVGTTGIGSLGADLGTSILADPGASGPDDASHGRAAETSRARRSPTC